MLIKRRDKYIPCFYQTDFWVVKHLNKFLHAKLNEYVMFGKYVCDIGCGEQPLRLAIENLGGKYLGVDITNNTKNNVDVIANIHNVPLPDNTFDVILCSEVLEHVMYIESAFNELARLLKPGGHIIITSPFAYPLHEEPFDYVRITPYMIRECASAANLDIVQLNTTGNELEVMAVVWCNMWERMISGNKSISKKIFNAIMNTPVNVFTLAFSCLFEKSLPQKYFLSSVCVLSKAAKLDIGR